MTSSEARHRALTLGPAAAVALAAGAALRVHSVFEGLVNLEVAGSGLLLAISGPAGAALAQAVALERPVDFRTWGLTPGSPVANTGTALWTQGPGIDLTGALRRPARCLAVISGRPGALQSSLDRLTAAQAAGRFELSVAALQCGGGAGPALADRLNRAAAALVAALGAGEPLGPAIAALVGLGPGLTPAGDDFLGGILAALRARAREPLLAAAHAALEAQLDATSSISAALLRWAIRDHWPEPLLDLAAALAADDPARAGTALDALCALGHSSGADLATGFLCGVAILEGVRPMGRPGAYWAKTPVSHPSPVPLSPSGRTLP